MNCTKRTPINALAYKLPRSEYQDILGVENAFPSRRRADCGPAEYRPTFCGGISGSVDSSINWLEYVDEPSAAATMADRSSWESANASESSTQQTTPSPVRSSPLQSSSSHSSHECVNLQQPSVLVGATSGPGSSTTSGANTIASRGSLIETLQTCLTSLPTSSSSAAASPTLKESRSGSTSSSRALGPPTKQTKRRSRASRRVPTTVLEASASDFRQMVQRLTGIPATAPAPVRPLPQRRAAPTTFIRPDHRPLATAAEPLTRPSPALYPTSSLPNFFLPPNYHLPPTLHRIASHLDTPLRSAVNVGSSSSAPPYSNTYSDSSMATTRSLPVHHEPSRLNSFPPSSSSASSLANAMIVGTSCDLPNVESSAAGALDLLTLPEENVEFSMSQFDDWLSGPDDH